MQGDVAMKKISLFSKNNRLSLTALVTLLLLFTVTSALAAGGTLDPAFGSNGVVLTDLGGSNDTGTSVLIQQDGRLLVTGYQQTDSVTIPAILRFYSDGTPDNTFGVNGRLTPQADPSTLKKIAVQSDGKLIVAGSSGGTIYVARYDANGTTLDTTFGSNGVATLSSGSGFSRYGCSDIAIQPDNKIVVVGNETNDGNFTNIIVARFTSNGLLDETFVSNGAIILDKYNFPYNRYNHGRSVAIQPDGKIIIAGDMMDDNADFQIVMARFNPDGSLDTANFGTNGQGTVITPLSNFRNSDGSLIIQANGKILVAGTTSIDVNDELQDLVVARFNPNGSLDTTFDGTGVVITDLGKKENANGLALQSDGKVILTGRTYDADTSDVLVARYNVDGTLDQSFGTGGVTISDLNNASDSALGGALLPTGQILAVGSSNGDVLLAQYQGDSTSITTKSATYQTIGGFDGWILESGENTNIGGYMNKLATVINVGDDVRDRQYRSILSFNTISLPDNAVIVSAEVKVKRQGAIGQDPFNTHGNLLVEPRLGLFSNNINLQLGDFKAAASTGATPEILQPSTPLNWYSAILSNSNELLINKYGVTQFRLRFTKDDNDDLGADYVKFFSGEAADAYRPQLIINYYIP
jgi:uncharacterized delta-60 repeat protein